MGLYRTRLEDEAVKEKASGKYNENKLQRRDSGSYKPDEEKKDGGDTPARLKDKFLNFLEDETKDI